MAEKVRKLKLEREPDSLYFIDKECDISRTLMARNGMKDTTGGKKKAEKKTSQK
jgi:hypothetical protein